MIKVFLICSGSGHIHRGYESFTQECFEALSENPLLDITLFQGGPSFGRSTIQLWNLPRNHLFTKQLASQLGKFSHFGEAYFLEQASFCLSLIPHLYSRRPDVIYFSDFEVGTMLWHWRRISGLSYKLLFSNGAPNGPPFSRVDHVQHLTPIHYRTAVDAGEAVSRHSLVPYGIKIPREYTSFSTVERNVCRQKLDLPTDRPLILSVGTINKSHKRMDYLIREIAQLPEPRPYVLLLGQFDRESEAVIQLGNQLLGTKHFQAKTVSSTEITDYYRVADLFVLSSLSEGFGRVFLEAMSLGLPCLTHDYEVTRFVLGEHGYFANFELPESLAKLVSQVLVHNNEELKYQRHQSVYDRFSWEKLAPSYIKMIQSVANG
jgi:1,2-diacylglycerol 3-alpha-glucosyltransferase